MKIEELQKVLQEKKIDLALISHPDSNLTYLTGQEFSYGFILVPKKGLPELYITKLDSKPRTNRFHSFFLTKNSDVKLKKKKPKIVGINKKAVTLDSFKRIKKLFPKAKFVDICEDLLKLRKEKTKEELKKIKKACAITSNAFTALCKELTKKTLKTEIDVAIFVENYFRKSGAQAAFPTIAAIGKNAAIPHHVTSKTKLSRGFLLVDMGAKWENYCADMTRCVFLGTLTKKELGFYNLLLKAQQNTIKSVKESVKYEKLTATSKKLLGKYSKNFTHSLGHGIGVEVHENPVFSDSSKVKKNVPFTIEPGIYFSGKFGLRIEDTLYYDGKKVVVLTKASKELLQIKTKP